MRVIVDTCIWSKVFRHNNSKDNTYHSILKELIIEKRAYLIGAIRQEVLSGIKSIEKFEQVKTTINSFPDLFLIEEDYCRAAEMYNLMRNKGIQGSHIDFLICAAAEKYEMDIFTEDKDFYAYVKHLPINLYPNRH